VNCIGPHAELRVLIRGLAREAGHWGDFAERFRAVEPDAQVIAVDLPGAGELRHHHAATHVEQGWLRAASSCSRRRRLSPIVYSACPWVAWWPAAWATA
jgi:hypothetical protein